MQTFVAEKEEFMQLTLKQMREEAIERQKQIFSNVEIEYRTVIDIKDKKLRE